MKALPISENEIGVVYKINKSAFFFPLDCAYYKNILVKDNLPKMSFEKFLKLYPRQLKSNHYTSSNDK